MKREPIRGCKCGCDERAEAVRFQRRCEFVRSRVNPDGSLAARVIIRQPIAATVPEDTRSRDLAAERAAAESRQAE